MQRWLLVGTTLACGLHNDGLYIVGATLVYDWLNVGVWLVQCWFIVGATLANYSW